MNFFREDVNNQEIKVPLVQSSNYSEGWETTVSRQTVKKSFDFLNLENEDKVALVDFISAVQELGVQIKELEMMQQTYLYRKRNDVNYKQQLSAKSAKVNALANNLKNFLKREHVLDVSRRRLKVDDKNAIHMYRMTLKEYDTLMQYLIKIKREYQRLLQESKSVKKNIQSDDGVADEDMEEDDYEEAKEYGASRKKQEIFKEVEEKSSLTAYQKHSLALHLMEAEQTTRELREMEESYRELQSLVQDLRELVDKQGDDLNKIESQGEDSIINLEVGVEELTLANKNYKTGRGMMWIIIVLVILSLVVLAILLAFGFGTRFL